MKTITTAELNERLAAEPGLALLDVRTPVEFAEVHVAQARNVPLDGLKAWIRDSRLPKDQPVCLICRTGNRAGRAAERFAREGWDQAFVVEGGTAAWIEAGFPVHRGAAKAISLERQVRIAAGSLVLLGVVLGWLAHPGFFALAAFVGAGLVFAGVTDLCGMGLLLARLPHNKRKTAAPPAP